MKQLFIFILSIVGILTFGQSELTVLQAGERTPIANAKVKCNNKTIATTNNNGTAKFKTKCRIVEISANGFYEDEILVDKIMESTLSKMVKGQGSIQKIVLEDKSDDKALAILEKVNENFKNNSPQSLNSYSFKSYEKISLDMDEDTIQSYNDFLRKRFDSLKNISKKTVDEDKKKDSLEALKIQKLLGKSKMFLWEKAQEFSYSKKYGEKITVLDNRLAGLNQPIYELLTIKSNRTKIPKEVRRENFNLYRYFLTDTLDVEGRKNYVIRYREAGYKQPINKRKFNGYIYIDVDTYGIKKIESSSRKKNEGRITSIWIPIDNKWFLQKEYMKLKAGSMNFKKPADKANNDRNKEKFGLFIYQSADYFDYKTNFQEKSKDFRGYTMEVKNSDGNLLKKYRTQSLSDREANTYAKIDSVGKKYRLDQKANIFAALLSGDIRVGKINFDATQILNYNQYEGVRLGLAGKLNESFHRYISPDAYIAYGVKDKGFKYGVGVDLRTTLRKNSFFRAEYYNDVSAAGRFNENLWNFRMTFLNAGVSLNNDRYYHFKGFKVSYENDLTNALTVKIAAYKNSEKSTFDYDFNGLGNQFHNFSTVFSVKYSPNSKNIMTPNGKYTFEQNYPEFYFNYEQGMKALGGQFNFNRFDLMAMHIFKTKLGTTGVRAYAGFTTGEAPIWHQFQMNGLGKASSNFNFNFTSYLGYATMSGGKYFSDKFTGFYITHRIPWNFRSFGQETSSFDVVYRGIIGDMKHPEQHRFNYSTLKHLYQEAGLEWNNFLSTGLNLGFFYRVGNYHTSSFKDNFAVQLKLKLLGF